MTLPELNPSPFNLAKQSRMEGSSVMHGLSLDSCGLVLQSQLEEAYSDEHCAEMYGRMLEVRKMEVIEYLQEWDGGIVPRRASATSGYQRLLHSEAIKTLNWFQPAECNASQFQRCLPFVIDKHPAQVSAD